MWVSVCLDVGVAVAPLSSLESVLIKKVWFYCKRAPEGSRLHSKHVLKQDSSGGRGRGGIALFRVLVFLNTFDR